MSGSYDKIFNYISRIRSLHRDGCGRCAACADARHSQRKPWQVTASGQTSSTRKGAQDAKRGKIFTRLIKEITVAARLGGADPGTNPRLRLAVDKAYANNMPKDNVERAIKRGTGELEGVNYEEIRYEGYGIGGAAVIVDCMTDNSTRTVADVRHAFTKYGGNLGTDGSVAFLFKHCGQMCSRRAPARTK